MEVFSNLSQEEIEKLFDAPALITILIGGSDGNLDGEERTWAEKLLRAKSFSGWKDLQDFYRVAAEGFWVRLQYETKNLPEDIEARNKIIVERLEALNPLIAKLHPHTAFYLYKGFCTLAHETAKASGGFLRIGAVSDNEQPWLNLPMLVEQPRPADLPQPDQSTFDENIWGEKPDSDD